MIAFTVPGPPVAKARHRTAHNRAYTPRRTAQYERAVALHARAAYRGRATHRPVSMHIKAVLPIPVSWPKWKRDAAQSGHIVPTGKPDASNIAKSIEDALNGIAYHDDSQIVSLQIVKLYGDRPRAEIVVRDMPHAHQPNITRKQWNATS